MNSVEETKKPRSRSKSSTNETKTSSLRKSNKVESKESKTKTPKKQSKRTKTNSKVQNVEVTTNPEKKVRQVKSKSKKNNLVDSHDNGVSGLNQLNETSELNGTSETNQSNETNETNETNQPSETKPKATKKTKERKKRVLNFKPTVIEKQGIGIGPARVKNVLAFVALNKDEYFAKEKINEAENKPKKPKPTKENPNPEMPTQGEQKPVNSLPEDVLSVLHKAEQLHEDNLRSSFDKEKLSQFSDDEKKKYNLAKHNYVNTLKDSAFNAQLFNSSYSPTFYNEFPDFKKRVEEENKRDEYEQHYIKNMDVTVANKYQTEIKRMRKEANEQDKIFNKQAFNKSFDKKFYDGLKSFKSNKTEWTRAVNLISKLLIRISIPTRYILASFLDQVVMQYFLNGAKNCVESGKSTIQLEHALHRGDDFENNVPLDKFVRTLDAYNDAVNWLQLCDVKKRQFLEEKKLRKASNDENQKGVKFEEPAYPEPTPKQEYGFGNYINDICRHVHMNLLNEVKDNTEKYDLYQSLKCSQLFKSFCSYIVYQTIVRVGSSLKFTVENGHTKTVSASLMSNTINNICLICGINYQPVMSHIERSKNKYNEYKENSNKLEKNNDQTDNDNESEVDLDGASDKE